jgi:hypothetical protein
VRKEIFLGSVSEQRREMRTIVFAPTGRDAELMSSFIARLGKQCIIVRNVSELCSAIAEGAGSAIVAEEAQHLCRRRLLAVRAGIWMVRGGLPHRGALLWNVARITSV